MDIDCMPTNPLEYIPEGLRRQIDKCLSIKKEPQQLSGNSNLGVSVIFPPCGLEGVGFAMNPPLNQGDMMAPILHGKVSTNTSTSSQQINQSYITNYSKAREAEIQRALALQHALDEKEMEPEMVEIVKGSRRRAQAMVDAAIKAASSVKEGEDGRKKIQEALDLIGKRQPLHGSMVKHHEHANGNIDHHNPSPSDSASEPKANNESGSEKNEAQMPSELITSCVATWLMIQMCTERQYPPADVAQLIDAAVTSLQPRCPQNLPIYREIQTCMGRIKTQILALIPT